MSASQRLATELGTLEPLDTDTLWARDPDLESLTDGHHSTEFIHSTSCCDLSCSCSCKTNAGN